MLGKLIKYEFKATGKFMLMIFGLLLALSSMMAVGLALNLDEVFSSIMEEFQIGSAILGVFIFLIIMLLVVLTVVAACGMFFYAISRFKNNLLGNEGYLMHTLPVKTRDHLISKCLVSVIWSVASFVVVLAAYFILFWGVSETNIFEELVNMLANVDWNAIGFQAVEAVAFMLEVALCLLLQLVITYLQIYASMAIGYSSNTHRVAKSIGVYVLITFALNTVETVFSFVFMTTMNVLVWTSYLHLLLWGGVLLNAACGVVLYFIAHHFMDKKLNLQ